MAYTVHLECCVCGNNAGTWEQHYNRDDGYGICVSCVAEQASIETPERLEQLYGKVKVNYDQPLVRHMGRRYKVLAATKYQNTANAFMDKNPNASVIKVFDDGLIVLVDKDDEGVPVSA